MLLMRTQRRSRHGQVTGKLGLGNGTCAVQRFLGDDNWGRLDQNLGSSSYANVLGLINAFDRKRPVAVVIQTSSEMDALGQRIVSESVLTTSVLIQPRT